MINLNALLRRRVEYYEYPWAIEGYLLSAQSRLRSLFQANDVGFIFSKSMPRSGHRFLTECLTHYFGPWKRALVPPISATRAQAPGFAGFPIIGGW